MRAALIVLAALLSASALAHPTSYQGAVAVMTWNQPFLSDNWIAYSYRADMAIAARLMRMEMPEGRLWAYLPQADFLLKRWNLPDAQANIYAYGAFGGVRMEGKSGRAGLLGVETDAESRSLFGSLKAERMNASIGPDFEHYEARVGMAPYEAEFDEIASWFMVQLQYHPTLEKKTVVTPLARFFYRNVLWEIGVSLEGDTMTNLMFHF